MSMKRSVLNARLAAFFGLLACTCWCAGCGSGAPPAGSVSGNVTYNGQPLASGVVIFENEKTGVGASAELDSSGTYRIESIRTGQYQVAIQPPSAPPPEEMEQGAEAPKLNIPDKYLNPQTSDLTATVNEGTNTADFSL